MVFRNADPGSRGRSDKANGLCVAGMDCVHRDRLLRRWRRVTKTPALHFGGRAGVAVSCLGEPAECLRGSNAEMDCTGSILGFARPDSDQVFPALRLA